MPDEIEDDQPITLQKGLKRDQGTYFLLEKKTVEHPANGKINWIAGEFCKMRKGNFKKANVNTIHCISQSDEKKRKIIT